MPCVVQQNVGFIGYSMKLCDTTVNTIVKIYEANKKCIIIVFFSVVVEQEKKKMSTSRLSLLDICL